MSREGAYAALRSYSRHTLWMMKALCNLRYEIRGEVPTGEVILAAKHQSYVDMLIITAHVPRPRFIMKKELRLVPALGYYAVRIGCIQVDRGKGGATVRSMVKGIVEQRGDGAQVVIFPQGTRVLPGVTMPYKIGVSRIYEAFGVPCVPSATNAGLFWPKKAFLRRPGTVLVEFLEPIPPGLSADAFMSELETRIETASTAQNVEAGFPQGRIAD
jgi:1-acyl-sn-glycerol-3-phosphate acyltransferase